MKIRVDSIADLDQVSDAMTSLIKEGFRVFLLTGQLGAGKTALVQSFCLRHGVREAVTSPTFSLVNEYVSPSLGSINHMDFYRLEKNAELEQIGLEEYLSSGHVCLIEWPEIAAGYFPMSHVDIKITVEPDNIRIFNITRHDAVDA